MKKQTKSGRITTTALVTQLLTLLFSIFLQASTASANTTIIGIDLHMSTESLDISKQVLKSALTQAESDRSFGLVIADELVRTVVEPQSAESLLAALADFPLDTSDSGNFSALLERSLAMADGTAADTTKLWIISSGAIKLGGDTNNTAKQERFQMWASDILLPDIAARYPGFRLISPEPNSELIINAVRTQFGPAGQQLLPATTDDVDRFVETLTADSVVIATSPAATDAPTNTAEVAKDSDADADPIEPSPTISIDENSDASVTGVNAETTSTNSATGDSNTITDTTASTQQAESSSTAEQTATESPAVNSSTVDSLAAKRIEHDTDAEATKTIAEQPVSESTSLSQETDSKPVEAVEVTVSETSQPVANTINNVANGETAPNATEAITIGLEAENQTEPVVEKNTTAVDLTVVDSNGNKDSSILMLAILGATSVALLVLGALLRKRRNRSLDHADSASFEGAKPIATTPSHQNTPEVPAQPPVIKPDSSSATVVQSKPVDEQSETIVVTEPTVSVDGATVITQPADTDATAVNPSTADHTSVPPKSVEDDFSAFDRSIIEKRWAKLDDEDADSSKKK